MLRGGCRSQDRDSRKARRNGPSKRPELEPRESVPGPGKKSLEGGVEERDIPASDEIHNQACKLVAFSLCGTWEPVKVCEHRGS